MIRNGFYNGMGTLIRIGMGVLIIPVLIRVMGLETYGLWVFATATVGIVELAEMGLSVSTTYFVARDLAQNNRQSLSETLTITSLTVLVVATCGSFLLWVISGPLLQMTSGFNPTQQIEAIQALHLGALVVWSTIVQRMLVGIQQAFQRYDLLNIVSTTQSIVLYAAMFVVILTGGRILGLMVANLTVSVLALVMNLFLTWRLLGPSKPTMTWNRQRFPEIARYSASTWALSISTSLFSKGDRLIIGMLASPELLGAYGAITAVVSKINTLSAAMVQPILPRMSRLSAQSTEIEQSPSELFLRTFRLNTAASLGIAGAMILMAPFLTTFLIGEESSLLMTSFVVATTIYGAYSINATAWYTLMARKRMAELLYIGAFSSLITLLLIAFGTWQYQLLGAIVGNAGYLLTLLAIWRVQRDLTLTWTQIYHAIRFPTLWITVVFGFGLLLPNNDFLRIAVAVFAVGLLFYVAFPVREMISRFFPISIQR